MSMGILSVFVEEHKEKLQKELEQRVKRVIIPMRIDPSVIHGAEVRTRFAKNDYQGINVET